jgi:NADPH:quinone reductase-like Zn-dependent oxidoreductase
MALVAPQAAPITPLDILCASGRSYFGQPQTPYVPGVQGAGIVIESTALAPGSKVWFQTSAGMKPGNGTMSEVAAVAEEDLLLLPEGVEPQIAAALGLSAVAAWSALTRKARLQPGETVIVLGAGGTVGQVAVQAARLLGAGRIVAAARTEEGRRRAARAGADATVDLSGSADAPALTRALLEAGDGPAQVVIDPVFGTSATAAMSALADEGRFVHLGAAGDTHARFESAVVRGKSLSILGYTNNSLDAGTTHDILTTVLRYAAVGEISVSFDPVPLSGVAEAWRRQASGQAASRIVLSV